jgi:hypothetical protein
MQLTSNVTFAQIPASVECLFTEFFCDVVNASFSNVTNHQMLPPLIQFAGAVGILENKLLFDQTIEAKATHLNFRNSNFTNSNIHFFESTSNLTLNNVIITSSLINITDANATIQNSIISQDSTMYGENAVITVRNTNLTITGDNVIIHAHNATIINAGTNIEINTYNTTTLRFVDTLGNTITRTYNITSALYNLTGTASSVLSSFLVSRNDVLNAFSLLFFEDFLYFPNNQSEYSFIDAEQTLVFERTGLPNWNYDINGSRQTDFRNFELLTQIESLPQANFSIGEGLNITFTQPANYSGLDFTQLIGRPSLNSVYIGFEHNFTVSLNHSPSERVVILPGFTLAEVGDNNITFSGNTTGTYAIVSDIVFSVSIPGIVPFESDESLEIVYQNYNGSINEIETCTINIGDTSLHTLEEPFKDLSVGQHTYVVNCIGDELPTRTQSGTFEVKTNYFTSYQSARRFAEFSLEFVLGSDSEFGACDQITLTNNLSTSFGAGVLGELGRCVWTVVLPTTSAEFNLSNATHDDIYTETITIRDGRYLFDERDVIASITQTQNILFQIFFFTEQAFFTSHFPLVTNNHKFNVTGGYNPNFVLNGSSTLNPSIAVMQIKNNKQQLRIVN